MLIVKNKKKNEIKKKERESCQSWFVRLVTSKESGTAPSEMTDMIENHIEILVKCHF